MIFGRAKPGAKKFINFNHRDHNQANEKYQLNWAYSQRNPPSASEIKTLGRQTLGHAAPKSEVSPKLANRLVAQGGAGESLKSDQAVAGVAASISAVQDKLLDGQSKLADNGTSKLLLLTPDCCRRLPVGEGAMLTIHVSKSILLVIRHAQAGRIGRGREVGLFGGGKRFKQLWSKEYGTSRASL